MSPNNTTMAILPAFGCLKVTGSDAAKFLNNQLSSKIETEPAVTLSAWLNVKGRVIADFWMRPTGDGFALFADAALAERMATELKRYVFRDKVSLGVAAPGSVVGLIGDPAGMLPDATRVGGCLDADAVIGAQVPGRQPRWLLLDEERALAAPGAEASTDLATQWLQMDIEQGVLIVDEALSEQYLAQNLNLDALGGISFSKGCYPGQEIVARVKYRGKVKQRLFTGRASGAAHCPRGSRVIDSADASAVGEVVATLATGDDSHAVLLILDVERAGATLALADAPDVRLALGELPYPVEF